MGNDRKKDKKPMRIKLSDLSDEDILFIDRLQWDGEKTKTPADLDSLGSDQA